MPAGSQSPNAIRTGMMNSRGVVMATPLAAALERGDRSGRLAEARGDGR